MLNRNILLILSLTVGSAQAGWFDNLTSGSNSSSLSAFVEKFGQAVNNNRNTIGAALCGAAVAGVATYLWQKGANKDLRASVDALESSVGALRNSMKQVAQANPTSSQADRIKRQADLILRKDRLLDAKTAKIKSLEEMLARSRSEKEKAAAELIAIRPIIMQLNDQLELAKAQYESMEAATARTVQHSESKMPEIGAWAEYHITENTEHEPETDQYVENSKIYYYLEDGAEEAVAASATAEKTLKPFVFDDWQNTSSNFSVRYPILYKQKNGIVTMHFGGDGMGSEPLPQSSIRDDNVKCFTDEDSMAVLMHTVQGEVYGVYFYNLIENKLVFNRAVGVRAGLPLAQDILQIKVSGNQLKIGTAEALYFEKDEYSSDDE